MLRPSSRGPMVPRNLGSTFAREEAHRNLRIPRKQEKEIIRYALVRRSKFGQSVSCHRANIIFANPQD